MENPPGFAVYQVDPLKALFFRPMEGGIAQAEMLYRTNVFALIAGGENPAFDPHYVKLWDDSQAQVIGELEFKEEPVAVKLTRSKLIILLEKRIYVYNF